MGNVSVKNSKGKVSDQNSPNKNNPAFQFSDHRPESIFHRQFSKIINPSFEGEAVLGTELEEEMQLKEKGIDVQLKKKDEDLQMKSKSTNGISQNPKETPVQQIENNTGLPDQVKSGVENHSGYSLDDVNVHYNSAKPAQLNAHAFAQGKAIHIGPCQEQLLPHEAWHVVQQKQGRVRPTKQLKAKVDLIGNPMSNSKGNLNGVNALQRVESVTSGLKNSSNLKGQDSPIQRNEESTQVLDNLAEPIVGEQDVDLATSLQEKIDKIYTDIISPSEKAGHYNAAVCLGGIILPALKKYNNLESLIKDCSFVNLGKGSVGRGIFELLGNDVKKDLIANTLLTMYQAKQLDYLWYSKFGGNESSKWKVVVEVHYYRSRESTKNTFHKDTLGQTLFVNLNYLNSKKIVGPEYMVNPEELGSRLKQIAAFLPEEFLEDRESVMGRMKAPEIIEVVDVPKYGYVAFVDEMIHHSSPTTKRRSVKGSELYEFIESRKSQKSKSFKKLLKNTYQSLPEAKSQFRIIITDNEVKKYYSNVEFNKPDLVKLFSNKTILSMEEIDECLHEANQSSFGKVRIANPENRNNTHEGKLPKLERRMSQKIESGSMETMEKESGGRRSFFRTWVRAEKIETPVIKNGWRWEQVQ
jgi:hypothetical protein